MGDHAITGWFEDGLGSDNPQRWQAYAEGEDASYMIEIEEGSFKIPLALKATHGIQVNPEEGDVPVSPSESEDPGKAEDPVSVKTVSAEKAEVVATQQREERFAEDRRFRWIQPCCCSDVRACCDQRCVRCAPKARRLATFPEVAA